VLELEATVYQLALSNYSVCIMQPSSQLFNANSFGAGN